MTMCSWNKCSLAACLVATAWLASLLGCGGDDAGNTEEPGDPADFSPDSPTGECNLDALLRPHSYGAKVKTLITGLPLTDAELVELQADPDALGSLIDGWVALPEAEAVFERFFMTAFQQTGTSNETLFYLLGRNAASFGFFRQPSRSATTSEMLNANMSESFARTVTELIRQGRPFSEVLTTESFMMTTAMAAFLAYSDDEVVADDESKTLRTTEGHFPAIKLVRDQVDAPPAAEALDPQSPSFATFWHERLAELPPECDVQPIQDVSPVNIDGEWRLGGYSPSYFVWSMMMGRHQGVRRHNTSCAAQAINDEPLFARSDFSDWHMVKISRPSADTPATLFYDLDTLRSASEIYLHTERIGFFTTPGFFSTWMNNEDNAARVTINQTLIVSLLNSFDGAAVNDFSPENLDAEHAAPDSECYGCHQTLDPMRDYIRASYTNFYGQQLDPDRTSLQADFVFGEVTSTGSGVRDLAQTLAQHPEFPRAWANRLCYYANSEPCADGPELDRVVGAFVDSGLNWKTLVRELFSSPLITGSACIEGVDAGTTATIARRSTFCAQLSHRLGVDDICGLRTDVRDATALQNDVRNAVASVPDEGYSRAVIEPVVIAETGLFTRANREAACTQASLRGYDEVYGADTMEDALLSMVTEVMGLPVSDPRHASALAILEEHANEVMDEDGTERVALQSALVLACMSPGASGVGF